MLSRRRILAGMAATVGAAWASPGHALARRLGWAGAKLQAASAGTQPSQTADTSVEDRLRQDQARLASRADSEEGVPVILACEDYVAERSLHRAPVQLTLFNLAFASELRSNAAAWERLHPNAPVTDVSSLIQILAYRDFDRSRLEQRP